MTFSRFLRLFGNTQSISKGRATHAKIIVSGSPPNDQLLSMYVKFNRTNDALNLFDEMPQQTIVSWTTLISGYSKTGYPEESLNCFRLMVSDGFKPDDYSYVAALSASASIRDGKAGKEIHGMIFRYCFGFGFDVRVSNSLINMYGKSGLLDYAFSVFDVVSEPNSVTWTTLLSSCCQCGENLKGMKVFSRSRVEGIRVNEFSCSCLINACTDMEDLRFGLQVHLLVLKCGLHFDTYIVTGLIKFYAVCRELVSASRVFFELNQPDLSAWTALIGCYVQHDESEKAVNLFVKLLSSGLKPNEMTFASVLGAGTHVRTGSQLHGHVIKTGFALFTFVGNALLDFYSKRELLDESTRAFHEMGVHDIVSWNALISGRVGSGRWVEAIDLLKDMLVKGHEPNLYTYSTVLSICSNVPAIEWGKQTHCRVLKPGFSSNVVVGTALIDMYSKCGRLSDARKLFDNLGSKNVISWNAMLVGYAQHGFGKQALEIYDAMVLNATSPNDVTFLGVLSACGHAGLVEEGWKHYESMVTDYGIVPGMDHVASLVNVLSRKGETRRAYEFIENVCVEPSKVVWRCLLSGCRTHGDVVLGKYAADKILSIDSDDVSAHVMLSNIYAEAKMWDETADMRRIMKLKSLKKDTGFSWMELKKKIYCFSASDYLQYEGINNLGEVLNGLTAQLVDVGYVPDALLLLQSEE